MGQGSCAPFALVQGDLTASVSNSSWGFLQAHFHAHSSREFTPAAEFEVAGSCYSSLLVKATLLSWCTTNRLGMLLEDHLPFLLLYFLSPTVSATVLFPPYYICYSPYNETTSCYLRYMGHRLCLVLMAGVVLCKAVVLCCNAIASSWDLNFL